MKKELLTYTALLLICQSCDLNQPQFEKLRAENHELKIRLAALGQDTTTEAAALASVPASNATSDTSTTPKLSLGDVAGANEAGVRTTSIWKVKHYSDQFGEATKQGFIGNEQPIQGTFSNSATQDSPLLVQLLIDPNMDASIKLYEYAGNNPVKKYGSEEYDVNVKDKDGKAYHLTGTNYESDRLTLDKSSSKKLHAALLKGGKLQMVIRESETSTTVYGFFIDNADGYLAARKELRGVK